MSSDTALTMTTTVGTIILSRTLHVALRLRPATVALIQLNSLAAKVSSEPTISRRRVYLVLTAQMIERLRRFQNMRQQFRVIPSKFLRRHGSQRSLIFTPGTPWSSHIRLHIDIEHGEFSSRLLAHASNINTDRSGHPQQLCDLLALLTYFGVFGVLLQLVIGWHPRISGHCYCAVVWSNTFFVVEAHDNRHRPVSRYLL